MTIEVNKKRMTGLYYLCATKGNIDQLLGEGKLSGYFESFKDIFSLCRLTLTSLRIHLHQME